MFTTTEQLGFDLFTSFHLVRSCSVLSCFARLPPIPRLLAPHWHVSTSQQTLLEAQLTGLACAPSCAPPGRATQAGRRPVLAALGAHAAAVARALRQRWGELTLHRKPRKERIVQVGRARETQCSTGSCPARPSGQPDGRGCACLLLRWIAPPASPTDAPQSCNHFPEDGRSLQAAQSGKLLGRTSVCLPPGAAAHAARL